MKSQLFLVAILALGAQAIPFKNNTADVERLLREKERVVNENVAEFVTAAESGDVPTLKELTKVLVKYTERAHDVAGKLTPSLERLESVLRFLTTNRRVTK